MITYTFAYGSLLNPDSLRSTLPFVDVDSLIPARLRRYVRTWDVAFPNDGSQGDKAYINVDRNRPPFILFANLSCGSAEASVNGVLIPVEQDELTRLSNRELRYELVDVSASTDLYDSSEAPRYSVSTFLGRDEFTQPINVARGVVPRSYLDSILTGVSFWEERFSGFAVEFHESTVSVPDEKIADLVRVDH